MTKGLAAAAALFTAAALAARLRPPPSLPPLESVPVAGRAVQDVSLAAAGLRRLGGDLAFIQLLQYFSEGEGMGGREEDEPHEHGEGHAHSHAGWMPRFLPLSLRVLTLSPYSHGVTLFCAGSLGFVMDRPREALELLALGARRDPTFWRYRLYAGAIAYRQGEDAEKVIVLLEEALKYPDCPSMLQNILANLHKKQGHYGRAAEIYEFTSRTARDSWAVDAARRQLERLRAEGRIP